MFDPLTTHNVECSPDSLAFILTREVWGLQCMRWIPQGRSRAYGKWEQRLVRNE